jgi:di/tricarboxylate transporter
LLSVNSAFLTPVSSPLNLLVYGPGGYRSTDYLRIGLPLKLVYLTTAIVAICLIYDI